MAVLNPWPGRSPMMLVAGTRQQLAHAKFLLWKLQVLLDAFAVPADTRIAVTPTRIVDPTGVGDAFRGGLMKGIAMGLGYQQAAQLGSVAATYALEHLGGQSHSYSFREFMERYEQHFPPIKMTIA